MTQQRIPYIIQVSTSASLAVTQDLDYRFAPQQIRSIAGSVTSGDTVTVLVSPVPGGANAKVSFIGDLSASIGGHTGFFVTVSSYTANFSDIISGPWCRIKVTKSGSNGSATVYLLG